MRRIGFSTGALARGDFRSALATLQQHQITLVELSALRAEELEPLLSAIPKLDLTAFSFVSVHAPSRFGPEDEDATIHRLAWAASQGYPVIVHPDVIYSPSKWRALGSNLLIENMDKRKPVGRTARELQAFFTVLPAARFCFDIGHARQVDPSMTEAVLLLDAFNDRLAEIHMSEVNTASRHDPISRNAVAAFSRVLSAIPEDTPIILEPLIDKDQSDVRTEVERAHEVFSAVTVSAA
jgi:hypothetical protein